jgi:hypothetical protein
LISIQASAMLLPAPEARAQTTWSMDSFAQTVAPMRNRLDSRFPVVAWTLPQIAFKNQAATDYANGVLGPRIATLWARGVVPAIMLDEAPWATDDGIRAVARAVQDIGAPVHAVALLPGAAHKFWPDAAWFTLNGISWPVFPQADPQPAYAHMRQKLAMVQAGGITINALWQDYEDLPYPWNGAYAAQNTYVQNVDSQAYARAGLDAGLPSDWVKFQKYAYDLRYALFEQSLRRALGDTFGTDPPYGNYGNFRSTSASPAYDLNGVSYPPSSTTPGTVAMPVLYANNRRLPWYIGSNEEVTQAKVDDIHWFLMMRTFSASAANDTPGDLTVPFVSPAVFDLNDPRFNGWSMSEPAYRELLKHLWLRGADGMIAFTVDPTTYTMYSAAGELTKIEDVRAVLDEMLNYREFLQQGTALTFAFDTALNYGARTVWSGLARTNDAIVQVTSRNGSTQPATVDAFGESFSLKPAPSAGATYYLHSGQQIHRVDQRPYTAYLRFESSPSTSLPGATIRSGVYGFETPNTHSVELSYGNRMTVGAGSGAFDTPSFTAEVFLALQTGTADRAELLSKGSDWSLRWRDDARLELTLSLSTGSIDLCTAGDPRLQLDDGWHHIAIVVDGTAQTARLYLDHQPLAWQSPSDGSLPAALGYQGADIHLGATLEPLSALLDEFRFTPEPLDVYQLLRAF